MRIRIRFTHFFDFLRQVLSLPLTVACGAFPSFFISEASDNGFIQFLSILTFIFCSVASGYFWLKYTEPLSTKLYIFFSCGVNVSYKEAKKISFLFDGSLNGKWYKLGFLRKIPKSDRKKIIFEFANKIEYEYYHKTSSTNYTKNTYQTSHNDNKTDFNNESDNKKTIDNTYSKEYKEYCCVLELNEKFSEEDLKKAYRKQIMKYHPDLYEKSSPELKDFANNKTILVNKAYEYLLTQLQNN